MTNLDVAGKTDNEIVAFGMTRREVADAVGYIEGESASNDEDTTTYSEYAAAMKRGRETLKKQPGYYPHLPAGV
jgi:hypothetical protein